MPSSSPPYYSDDPLGSKPPSHSPLYQKLVDLYGPIPPPADSDSSLMCKPLLRLLMDRLGDDVGYSLAILIGEWADGMIVIEAMAGPEFHKSDRKAVRKLARLGFISYDDKLDLATLNEETVLAYLNKHAKKGS